MSQPDPRETQRMRETLAGRLMLLGFGFAVLTFLVAIDRADWFAIRPATGTSIAMANAAAPVGEDAAPR